MKHGHRAGLNCSVWEWATTLLYESTLIWHIWASCNLVTGHTLLRHLVEVSPNCVSQKIDSFHRQLFKHLQSKTCKKCLNILAVDKLCMWTNQFVQRLTSQALTNSFNQSSLIFPSVFTFCWYDLSAKQIKQQNRINTERHYNANAQRSSICIKLIHHLLR